MKSEKEIEARIEELEKHRKSLNSNSRSYVKNRINELNWVLNNGS